MADITNIRQRRLEVLEGSSPAGAGVSPLEVDSGGTTKAAARDAPDDEATACAIPSEFECILCLRCVCVGTRVCIVLAHRRVALVSVSSETEVRHV